MNHYFPGAGLSPFNIRRVTVRWWVEYAGRAKAQHEAEKAQARKVRSGGK